MFHVHTPYLTQVPKTLPPTGQRTLYPAPRANGCPGRPPTNGHQTSARGADDLFTSHYPSARVVGSWWQRFDIGASAGGAADGDIVGAVFCVSPLCPVSRPGRAAVVGPAGLRDKQSIRVVLISAALGDSRGKNSGLRFPLIWLKRIITEIMREDRAMTDGRAVPGEGR